jgi:putative ABC transport system permease protein
MIGVAKYLPLLVSSLRRKRLRTFFTVASILIAFLLYGLAQSLQYALKSGVDVAGADRMLTMHKVSFTQLLPASYENRIRAIDGVIEVTPQTWFGAWYRDERNQIPPSGDPEAFRIYRRQVPKSSAGVGRRSSGAWSDADRRLRLEGR